MMDVKLAFGVRDGKTILISELTEAERGGNCNCTCPACGEPLIAKKGNKNRHHFAHKTDSTCDIAHANESALHRYAKEIIETHNKILLPGWKISKTDFNKGNYIPALSQEVEIELPVYKGRYKSYSNVHLEVNYGNNRADTVIEIDGRQLFVEIAVSHFVDEEKRAITQKVDIPMIEIDLKEFLKEDLTAPNIPDAITKAVLDNPENRKWIHNPARETILSEKEIEFNQKYKVIDCKHRAKIKEAKDKEQQKLKYKEKNIQILHKLMEPEDYKREILQLRSDRQADFWLTKLKLPEKIPSLDAIPFYLDIPISGEFIFPRDRRAWQGLLFEYICKYDYFYIPSLQKRIYDEKMSLHFDKSKASSITVCISGQEKRVSLTYDVLKQYFDYLHMLGFITWIDYNSAIRNPPTSLTPPNAHIAEVLQEAIRTVAPYHPNVDKRIEEELRKRIPDDPIWKNPFLSYTLKNTVYYAPSQK